MAKTEETEKFADKFKRTVKDQIRIWAVHYSMDILDLIELKKQKEWEIEALLFRLKLDEKGKLKKMKFGWLHKLLGTGKKEEEEEDIDFLYSKLSNEVKQKLRIPSTGPVEDQSILNRFLELNLPESDVKDIEKKIKQNIILSKLQSEKSSNIPHRFKKKELSLKEKRKLGLFRLSKSGFLFEDFLPLHNLWKEYIRTCLGVEQLEKLGWTAEPHDKRWQQFTLSLLKADYHGAYVEVVRSKCSSLVGLGGIIILETKGTFKMIGEDDIVRVVPKENSMFKIRVDKYECVILGKHFCYRPSERSVKKIKNKVIAVL
ncbi:hypothetical protein J437_LFUL007602 [Ladona fulva]|uniref:Ribonuclease P protein subunit p29 n=1 Tax=Ladona fulva TaxID=123851 RepID=A0A8K0K6Z2_LADFU|nr:hypothetical protein J437_LFUL007602 [Ladona fulva]